jgi:hypothetical protein
MLSFGEGRPMDHAARLRLVDEDEQARVAEEAETPRDHAAWEKAERRRIYGVGFTAVTAMIALFARAFMEPPIRFQVRRLYVRRFQVWRI